ncbi:Phycobilisome Linker polypeptide [Stieleria bergensis]|uniref:Phycobilisome Linker polypeptide n=1 Tax=Stieleria bergensis TaxID=2528025 RepID=A0A517SR54_9BACT|nr:Phycobilisome Linker polypeptide [Planctomycetes bacterium SV_7m_r]
MFDWLVLKALFRPVLLRWECFRCCSSVRHLLCLIALLAGGSVLTHAPAVAAEPVAARSDLTATIDRAIRSAWQQQKIEPADRCSDPVFVRRVYLDLLGRVPTMEERDTFLANASADRRSKLVDQLLTSPEQAEHFADLFDAILLGRGNQGVYDQREKHGWKKYLVNAIAENRPWNDVAAEVLLARPEAPQQDGAVWFLYEKKDKYQEIAEAVAPAFFGIRIECAQCHDHMMVDEITQADYWGLVAFFNRGKNKMTPNGPRVVESAIGGFSEFADLTGSSSPNRLQFMGKGPLDEARPKAGDKQQDKDELYIKAAVKNDPRVPKFSRREQFVKQVLVEHPLLARAMVNRLWAIMMGRGLVHPYDEIDSMHPPSHPELLDALTQDFRESGFQMRRLVRALANSEAYQLQAIRPESVNDPQWFAWYLQRPLTAEQMARSLQVVLRGEASLNRTLLASLRTQVPDVLPDNVQVDVTEALFMTNGAQLEAMIQNSRQPQSLHQRTLRQSNHPSRAKWLVDAVLGRSADQAEIDAITAYLAERDDRLEQAIDQVIWSLVSSGEFRFNH